MQTYYHSSGEVPSATYQSFEQTPVVARQAWPTRVLVCAAMVFVCVVAFLTYAVAEKTSVQTFVAPALQAARAPTAIPRYASRRGREQAPPPSNPFGFEGFGAAPPPPPPPPSRSRPSFDASGVTGVAGVGAKVVSELALYLAFNTAYFVSNTYQFLTEEQQKKLAKETVDKQLPELLELLGGASAATSKTLKTVADTEEFKDLQSSASDATKELTKGIKVEGKSKETLDKIKDIVADEKGEVLSEERKANVLDILKKGGAKATELSLYVFYNTFSILRNLDRVLPSETQTDGIEGKIEELETKAGELVASVKELPSKAGDVKEKLADFKDSIPTAQDLAELDPAEVSLSIRESLANAKTKIDDLVSWISASVAEDSEVRGTLQDLQIKLKPVTDKLGELAAKLPLPKKEDGSIDVSELLAQSGIVTVKGLKALVEATKKSAGSVNEKTAAAAAASSPAP
jgi:hypothetical protein